MVVFARPAAKSVDPTGACLRALPADTVLGVAPEPPYLLLRVRFDAVSDSFGRLAIAVFSLAGVQHGKGLRDSTASLNLPAEIECPQRAAHAIRRSGGPCSRDSLAIFLMMLYRTSSFPARGSIIKVAPPRNQKKPFFTSCPSSGIARR
jgi:hypothetical protein